MSVFHKFTRKSLRRNPSRTLITVVGILLSMALLTAVLEGAYSGVAYLSRAEAELTGGFHGYVHSLSAQRAREFRADKELDAATEWTQVGWSEIDPESRRRPYLLIQAMQPNFGELVAFSITEGRAAQTDRELVLPAYLAGSGAVQYRLGDTVTLQVGERVLAGERITKYNEMYQEGETLAQVQERTYTVVGFYEDLDSRIVNYSCPGFVALTVPGSSLSEESLHTVFFTVKHPRRIHSFMNEQGLSGTWTAHTDLLVMYGTVGDAGLLRVLYGLVGILLFLIVFGSVSLIYNSFSISVGERMRQFGILKSVGATGRQIRSSVLYEALLLCAIAIPLGMLVGCVGIGITLWVLRNSFVLLTGSHVQMQLAVSPALLGGAALLCLLTTLLSAYLPARKAIRLNAIEAIRRTGDVKIRGRDVRVSGLSRRLFGFEGMLAAKNFKRDRKRYRATVFSLFLSVTLFISASSFCSYLTDSVEKVSGVENVDITYDFALTGTVSPDELLLRMVGQPSVQSGYFTSGYYGSLWFDSINVSGEYLQMPIASYQANERGIELFGQLLFLSDDAFRAVCAENGLEADAYFLEGTPLGIVCNFGREELDGQSYEYHYLHPSSLPAAGRLIEYRSIEGYTRVYEKQVNGQRYWFYYPDDYYEDYLRTAEEDDQPDESKAMRISASEAEMEVLLPLGAAVDDTSYTRAGRLTLLYPFSQRNALLSESFLQGYFTSCQYGLQAKQHGTAMEELTSLLQSRGLSTTWLEDVAAEQESRRSIVMAVQVFAYGFIILISLIALANVINTISTNVSLRRREFAMLRSVGMTTRGLREMTNFECVIYGLRGLMWGLPFSVLMTYGIYRVVIQSVRSSFYIPWVSVVIAVCSVFLVVFATMLYAMRKIRKENPIDALRTETL